MFTEQLTQALSLPASAIPPANYAVNNTTAQLSGAVDMSKFKRVMGIAAMGVMGGLNALIYFTESNASGGTYTNVASGASVLLDTDNTVATVEMRADQLGSGKRFVKLNALLPGNVNTGTQLAAVVLGGEAPYKPANANDVNTVSRSVM